METKVLLGNWDTEEEGELVGIQSVSPARKSWLLAILFLGMMLGRYVWGSLGDTLGRRVVLINTLVNLHLGSSPVSAKTIICSSCSGLSVCWVRGTVPESSVRLGDGCDHSYGGRGRGGLADGNGRIREGGSVDGCGGLSSRGSLGGRGSLSDPGRGSREDNES